MRFHHIALLLLPIIMIAGAIFASDQPTPATPASATQPTAEDLKVLQTGPEHGRLKLLVGEYDADYEIFASPDAAAQRSKGRIVNTLVYAGRFIEGKFECEMQGNHVTGQNLIGYDTAKKRYVGTWVSSGSTSIVFAEGDADATGKVIKMEVVEDKDNNSAQSYRTQFVTTFVDEDHYRFDTVVVAAGAEPFTVARINYSRHKQER